MARSILIALVSLAASFAWAGEIAPSAASVWPEGLSEEMNTLVAFRASFESTEGADVRLDMAAWYSYRITLNGRFVAFGPARGPKGLFRPDSWKLPVRAGRNDLQVEVAGYNCRNFYLMRQPPFFKASVSEGGRILAASGKDFSAYRLPRVQKVPRYSYQRTFCEAYEVPGREAGPLKLSPAPEPKLIARIAPPPAFEFKEALSPVAFSHLAEDPSVEPRLGRALTLPGRSPHFDGFPLDELTLNTAVLAQRLVYRDTRALTPSERTERSFALKDGASVRFDVGLNDTGFPGTTVTVKKPGRLVFVFDETLVDGKVCGSSRNNFGCTNLLLWDFTEPGVYEVDAFEPYTMRWLEVCVLSGEMSVAPARFRSYKNPTARAATFRASDPALGKIFEAAKETLMQNAVDVFTDCPSRERAGWNCDAFFTGPAATLLTGTTDLERVFEETQALAPKFEDIPDGMFPMCYPSDHKPGDFIPNWAMWFVLESEEYLARSGDRAMIDALRPRFEKLVEFLWTFRNADGLLEKLPSWVFVEWSKANDYVQDVNYPSNMTWAQTLDAMSRLYGRKDLAEEAVRVRAKIREQSWNGAFFRDHAVRGSDGRLVVQEKDITESCQYYAFFSGVATPETHPQLWRELLDSFGPARDEKKTHPNVARSAAFIGNYLRLKILERVRRGDLVLKDCKGYFEKMADLTGTLWENDDASASCCHGFAAYAAVLLAKSVLGIEKIDLLTKKLVLARDVRAELDWVEGSFPVGKDRIRVRREGKEYQTDVPSGWTVEYECGTRHEASPILSMRLRSNDTDSEAIWQTNFQAIAEHPGCCDEIWFSTGCGAPSLEWHRARAKTIAGAMADAKGRGIRSSLQFQATIGHGDGMATESEMFVMKTWTGWTDWRGVETKTCSCPRQRAFHDYLREVSRLYAPLKFSSLWIDDDLRIAHHQPADSYGRHIGCWCATCLAAFNAESGASWTREALAKAVKKDDALHARWRAFSVSSLVGVAQTIAEVFHALSPETTMALQHACGEESVDQVMAVLRKLRDVSGHSVGFRPGGGAYYDDDPNGILLKSLCAGWFRNRVGDPDWISVWTPEIESWPRTYYARSTQGVLVEGFSALMYGMNAMSFFISNGAKEAASLYGRTYWQTLAEAEPVLRGYAETIRGCTAVGFRMPGKTEIGIRRAAIPVLSGPGRAVGELTAAERALNINLMTSDGVQALRESLDARAKGLPAVVVSPFAGLMQIHVDASGDLRSVALLNTRIAVQGPVRLRLRRVPSDHLTVTWHELCRPPVDLPLERKGEEIFVTIPTIGAWNGGYLR